MSEMTERVARALCALGWGEDEYAREMPVEAYVDGHWSFWVKEAIAAIEAMREPTQAMIEAGAYAIDPLFTDEHRETAKDTWRAMLTEALK